MEKGITLSKTERERERKMVSRTYAPPTATANAPFWNLQSRSRLLNRGDLSPVQVLAPARAKTAMATNAAQKRRSNRTPKMVKIVIPPRKQTNSTAKAV